MIHKMISKINLALAACFVCMLFLVCSCDDKSGQSKIVRISVPYSVASIPILSLDGKEISGLTIRTTVFQDHSVTLAQFLRGDIDILMTGFSQGITAYAGNKNIRHLATPIWGVASLMVKDKSIQDMYDLSEMRIVVPFAKSPLDLQLRAIFKTEKVPEHYSIVYAPPQQAVALLLAGQADGIAVPEPFPSKLEEEGKARRLFVFAKEWAHLTGGDGRSPQVSFFAMNGWATKHTKAIEELLRIVGENIKEVKSDPVRFAELFATQLNLTRRVIAKGIENTLFDEPNFDETVKLCNDYLVQVGLPAIDPVFYFQNKIQ